MNKTMNETTYPRQIAQIPAYAVSGLIGRVHGASRAYIPFDALYYWNGSYYLADLLDYGTRSNVVRMPDGTEFDGEFLLNIYTPAMSSDDDDLEMDTYAAALYVFA